MRGLSFTNDRVLPAVLVAEGPYIERPLAMRHENVLPQRRQRLVVLELVARVVIVRAAAEDLDDERGICDGLRVGFVALGRSANHRHVRVCGETGPGADAQVGVVHTASTAAKLTEE